MIESTICFLQNPERENEILLGLKKTGFGVGKYAGIGGKVEAGETITGAAKREVREEIGVIINDEDLQFMGEITFLFPYKLQWDQKVSIFLAQKWIGEPVESDEMKPSWFKPGEIPYHSMWQDAVHWLPRIMEGAKICATISFKEDNETVENVALAYV